MAHPVHSEEARSKSTLDLPVNQFAAVGEIAIFLPDFLVQELK